MRLTIVQTRVVAAIVSGALVVPSVAWADRTVRCESSRLRYHYCPADNNGRVDLERQLSLVRCRQDDNWGHDRRGIWVDRGCSAEFRVAEGGSHHSGRNAAIAAGAAIAGMALIATLSSKNANQQADVASWAVGTFRGYDAEERANVELTILPGGSVSGMAGAHDFTGHLSGDRLDAGRQRFRIEQAGNGFIATDINNAGHRVHFLRSGSGY